MKSSVKKGILQFVLLQSILSSGLALGSETPKSVFGLDDRRFVDRRAAPFSSVFHLYSSDGTGRPFEQQALLQCTATLVGPRLFLTNAHCVLDAVDGVGRRRMRRSFRQTREIYLQGPDLQYRGGFLPRYLARVVAVGTAAVGARPSDDYAFLEVEENLGAEYGTLPLSQELNQAVTFPVSGVMLAGFSSDWAERSLGRNLPADTDCSIFRRDGSQFIHDCDSTRGSSGAGLIGCDAQGCRVIALNQSEIRPRGSEETPHYADQQASAIGNRATMISDEIFGHWKRLVAAEQAALGSMSFETEKNIFGADDRRTVDHSVAPFSSVVRIYTHYGSDNRADLCTGTLVGPDLVLTNAHCLTNALSNFNPMAFDARDGAILGPRSRIEVQVWNGLLRGNFEAVDAQVIAFGPTQINYRHTEDWAILKLASRAGDRVGFLPLSLELETDLFISPVSGLVLAGHSGDLNRGHDRLSLPGHVGCSIYGRSQSEYFAHDCDMTRGSSGAGLIRCEVDAQGARSECRVVALNSRQTTVNPADLNEQHTPSFAMNRANLAISVLPAMQALEVILATSGQ